MSLSQITDRAAVLAAIDEFDRKSREVFLHQYGFGRARSYFLVHNERRYDSKAILGVAHKYQFPSQGPLLRAGFSGGESGAARKLRELGFYVWQLDLREPSGSKSAVGTQLAPAYWALAANPRIYDVERALADGMLTTWTSRGKPLKPGDGVIIWRTGGRDGRRGIVAVAEVVGRPFRSSDEDDPYWLDRVAAAHETERVPIRIWDTPGLPLWIDGEHGELLRSLSVARATGGTVFHVEPEQWVAIQRAAIAHQTAPEVEDTIADVISPLKRRKGQGRGLNQVERQAVERHAMELAKAYYKARWREVEDVSATRSYDLECRSGRRSLHVEVKGTTGDGASILLTSNEVAHAQAEAPHVALFVVTRIELQRQGNKAPVVRGGVTRSLEPWDLNAGNLSPVAFQWWVPPPE